MNLPSSLPSAHALPGEPRDSTLPGRSYRFPENPAMAA
jgi:hypothetical protein